MVHFHYLDDIVMLSNDLALLRTIPQALYNFLKAQGLVISSPVRSPTVRSATLEKSAIGTAFVLRTSQAPHLRVLQQRIKQIAERLRTTVVFWPTPRCNRFSLRMAQDTMEDNWTCEETIHGFTAQPFRSHCHRSSALHSLTSTYSTTAGPNDSSGCG